MRLGDGLGVVQGTVLLITLLPRLRLFPVKTLLAQNLTVAGTGGLRTLQEIHLTLVTFKAGSVETPEACCHLLRLKHFAAASLTSVGVGLIRGELCDIHWTSGPRARPVTMKDGVARPAEDALVGAVDEASRVQGL